MERGQGGRAWRSLLAYSSHRIAIMEYACAMVYTEAVGETVGHDKLVGERALLNGHVVSKQRSVTLLLLLFFILTLAVALCNTLTRHTDSSYMYEGCSKSKVTFQFSPATYIQVLNFCCCCVGILVTIICSQF